MPLEDRNLAIGTRLVAKFKKEVFTCTVEAGDEGEGIAFVLADGRSFKSPSSAAVAITKVAQNGWRFWSLAEGEQPGLKAAAPKRKSTGGGRKKKTAPLFRRLPDTGLPEGMHRIWCSACQDGFTSETETPDACPNGHRADDANLNAAPTEAEQAAEAVA